MNMFELSGRCFDYQVSDYNSTTICERAVEVPVGLALLAQATDGECAVLEVGAVLPHYRAGWPVDGHTVIDLHEEYPGVTNADVLTWEPSGLSRREQYDLIISISTLDHLHNLEELIDALRRLRRWLAPGGLLFITLPFGQPAWVGGGEWIDRFVLGENDATTVWRMDKYDPLNHLWAQVHDMTIPPSAYHGPSLFANTVYMLLWGDVGRWWHT
jgi:SAM-dependent methyltransferase